MCLWGEGFSMDIKYLKDTKSLPYPEHKQSLKSLLLYIKIKFLTGKWHFKCKYLKAKQNKRKHKTCFKKITHLNGISLCV